MRMNKVFTFYCSIEFAPSPDMYRFYFIGPTNILFSGTKENVYMWFVDVNKTKSS